MAAPGRKRPRVNFLPYFMPPEPAKPRHVPQEYRCAVCGREAMYGVGVRLRAGQLGTWWCREHVPADVLARPT